METQQISKNKKAGLNEIATACERMVNKTITYKDKKGTRIGEKRLYKNTTQITIIMKDVNTLFLDDLNELIGVQYTHYNKYNNETEIEFVLINRDIEKILSKYGDE